MVATMATTQNEPTFHPFSRLPPELRLRIWSLNLPTSRLIPINALSSISSTVTTPNKQHQQPPGCTSSAPIPSNLHTIPESRTHALLTRYTPALSFAGSAPTLLIDFEADVLYFPPLQGFMASTSNFHAAMTLCEPGELGRVRRLALHEDVFGGFGGGDDWYGYDSHAAVERTVEVLNLVRRRLGGVKECVFLSRRGEGRAERLRDQVRTAMMDLGWSGQELEWNVMEEP